MVVVSTRDDLLYSGCSAPATNTTCCGGWASPAVMVAVATPSGKVKVSMAFSAKPLTRQALSIVTRSSQFLDICGAPVMALVKYLTVRSVLRIRAGTCSELRQMQRLPIEWPEGS